MGQENEGEGTLPCWVEGVQEVERCHGDSLLRQQAVAHICLGQHSLVQEQHQ